MFKILKIAISCFVLSCATPALAVNHPMDALTAAEINQTVHILRQKNIAKDGAQYPYIGLLEMPKAQLKKWQYGDPITRMVKVVLYQDNLTSEIEINLENSTILSQNTIDNVEPSVMAGEWHIARKLAIENPIFIKALAKRGITDTNNIYCSPNPAGHFEKKNYDLKRIFMVPCYERSHSKNHLYGRPIEGLFSVVDVEAKQVLEVVDTGVIPTPEAIFDYESGKNNREALNPVFSISPEGNNYQIKDGVLLDWQNWQFHMRMDKRVGPIVSMVKFTDGGQQRDVAYQMSLAEMFVPYQDPSDNWYYRTFLDNGEFGLGLLASSLTPGADCPVNATYLTINMPNDNGEVFQIERAVCIFERNLGEPLWRHGISGEYSNETRPMVDLVVRTIPVLGNYDYVVDFIFSQNGKIDIRVGATGILAVKGVKSLTLEDETSEADTQYGNLVAPAIVAPFHSHHFSFRLDLDVDGTENNLVSDIVAPVTLPEDSPRQGIWLRKQLEFNQEGAISANHWQKQWRIVNKNKKTKLKYNPSYQLMLGHQGTSVIPQDDAQRRALFTLNPLWVTKYNAKELYSAGDYPNQSHGGEGIVQYVTDKQDIDNQDIVLWPTLGFDHIPRVEDWPIMPTMFMQISIRPFNFFDQNPTMDVAPYFKNMSAPTNDVKIDANTNDEASN
ncbi:MAG: hypothetical protein OCD03_03475 [Hyphomicrobiales bacterium]